MTAAKASRPKAIITPSVLWRGGVVMSLAILVVSILAGCNAPQPSTSQAQMDSIAEHALAWQYRSIDTLQSNASQMMQMAEQAHDSDRKAEALNLLALHSFQQMDFDQAIALSDEARQTTGNQVEQLMAENMQMRVAQRTGDNRGFFVHRTNAERYIKRIAEELDALSPHMLWLYNHACGDFHIVSSTYFYYLDQQQRSLDEIRAAEPYCQLNADTAQWLYYNYMRGSGGLSESTDADEVTAYEFENLFKCFTMAKTQGYTFFYANALQSLATMFADSTRLETLHERFPDAVDYLVNLFGDDGSMTGPTSISFQMAFDALGMFVAYDDLFQSACALRTLGELCFADKRYDEAIECYSEALDFVNSHHLRYYAPRGPQPHEGEPPHEQFLLEPFVPTADTMSVERRWLQDPHVKTVPEWIAGIRQQMSVAFAALGNKQASDYNRNIYLDLLEETQHDMEPEVRMEQLEAESRDLRWTLLTLMLLSVGLVLMVWLLIRVWRRQGRRQTLRLRQAMEELLIQEKKNQDQLDEEEDELQEQQQATLLRIERSKRQNIEKHAKLQLVSSIVPFLDRIIFEVQRMQRSGGVQSAGLEYIDELVERINDYNALLTEWIQMEQGQLSLQLTSFDIEPIFESIRKAHYAYEQKSLTLNVQPTDLVVKADRALTLFMINTLAENARKFTPAGGEVNIKATAGEDENGAYVELSVQDTGNGMDQQTIDTILNQKVYDPNLHPEGKQPDGEGHGFGFGLMNCKGIIEKYRKTNPLFNVCMLGIESTVGQGSRFFFRLPRVATVIVATLLGLFMPGDIEAAQINQQLEKDIIHHAEALYYSNIDGLYSEGLLHADSAIQAINALHGQLYPQDSVGMTLSATPFVSATMLTTAEYEWATSGQQMDFDLILALRNEIAVAALALNDWQLYRNNNAAYTRLYKWMHRDATIETFGEQMQRSHSNQRIAMVLIVLMLIMACWAMYFFYFRPQLSYRKNVNALQRRKYDQMRESQEAKSVKRHEELELIADEHQRSLYEEGRLHVQNMIMDNCLSTIKHETMYYPPRIKQLVASKQLDALAETAAYYKEVYTILCAQAAEQASVINFRRQRLSAAPLLEHAVKHLRNRSRKLGLEVELNIEDQMGDATFRGDEQALMILIDALIDAQLSETHDGKWTLTCRPDDRFARFSITIPSAQMDEQQLHDLFAPHAGGVPYLLAKQVIREHDTYLGHPGCRIEGIQTDDGLTIWWTIPLAG